MSDDIDIEEHDVMDNVMGMYSNITIVKTETLDQGYEDPPQENTEERTWDFMLPTLGSISGTSLIEINNADSTTDVEAQSQSPRSNRSSSTTTQPIPFFGNKIIVGTRVPSPATSEHPDVITESQNISTNYETEVLLDDCSFYLKRSRRFCNDCQTLFPTEHALESHNMFTHSHLKVVDNRPLTPTDLEPYGKYHKCHICNTKIAHKCNLLRHYRNIHNVNTIGPSKVDKSALCKVCHKFIPNKDQLINHLYMHYDPKTNTIKKTAPIQPRPHQVAMKSTVSRSVRKPAVSVQNTKPSGTGNSSKELPVPVIKRKRPTLVVKKQPHSNLPYKCNACGEGFIDYNCTYRHFRRRHPELSPKKCIVKLTEAHLHEIRSRLGVTADKRVILPRGVLFKCTSCPTHFLFNSIGKSHIQQYCSDADTMRRDCHLCHLSFTSTSIRKHLLQHNYSKNFNVLEVITVKQEASLLISRCPFCRVYFAESKIVMHAKLCDNTALEHAEYCEVCDIRYDSGMSERHRYNHVLHKMKREDFTFIQYDVLGEKSGRAEAIPETITMSEPSNDTEIPTVERGAVKINLYYCGKCKSYCVHTASKDYHMNGKCTKRDASQFCQICQFCGINFSRKSYTHHQRKHEALKESFNLHNIVVRRVEDDQVISPPVPKYFECKKCYIHFESLEMCAKHKCNANRNFSTCQICKIHFSERAYKLHMVFHSYSVDDAGDGTLIEKYNSIQSTWNIVYDCGDCRLLFDNYTDVVEHCQAHFNSIHERRDVRACDVCNMRFPLVTHARHEELHHTNPSINRDSFTILPFSFEDLLKSNWLKKLYPKLDRKAIEQITKVSVYRELWNVKLEILREGLGEYTAYVCIQCGTCVAAASVIEHMVHYRNGVCKKISKKRHCESCGLYFVGSASWTEHELAHENETLTSDMYRVVTFNKKEDDAYNNNIINKSTEETVDTGSNKFSMFKCRKCNLVLSKRSQVVEHEALKGACKSGDYMKCSRCMLRFTRRAHIFHMEKHKRRPDFHIRNFKFRIFGPKGHVSGKDVGDNTPKTNEGRKKIIYYQCKRCHMNMLYKKSIVKHASHVGCRTSHQFKCSVCGLLFPEKTKQAHMRLHTTLSLNRSDFKIYVFDKRPQAAITAPKSVPHAAHARQRIYKFYQCSTCAAVVSLKHSVQRHIETCKVASKKVTCNVCKLVINARTTKKHAQMHKAYSFDHRNIVVEKFTKTGQYEFADQTKRGKKYTLYQCKACTVCFHKLYLLKLHKNTGCHKHSMKKCKRCGYRFSSDDLRNCIVHEKYHLRKDFTRDNIAIVSISANAAAKVSKKKSLKRKRVNSNDSYEPTIKMTIFKCKVCQSHFQNSATYMKHIKTCQVLATCETCGIKLPERAMGTHKTRNHGEKGINKADTSVEHDDIAPISDILYKCTICDVHFMTKEIIERHSSKRHVENIITSTSTCDTCGLRFPRTSLKNHVTGHHETRNYTKDDMTIIEWQVEEKPDEDDYFGGFLRAESYTKTVYRCSICDICFLTYGSIKSHMKVPHDKCIYKKVVTCDVCHLKFSFASLNRHQQIHHVKWKMSLEDLVVVDGSTMKAFTNKNNWETCTNDSADTRESNTMTEDSTDIVEVDKEATESNTITEDSTDIVEVDKEATESNTITEDSTDIVEVDKEATESNTITEDSTDIVEVDKEATESNTITEDSTDIVEGEGDKEAVENVDKELDEPSNTVNTPTLIAQDKNTTDDLPIKIVTPLVNREIIDTNDKAPTSYVCENCNEVFVTEKALQIHVKLDHIDSEVECPICEDNFNKSILDTIHLRINNDAFNCCKCGEKFPLDYLNQHPNDHP